MTFLKNLLVSLFSFLLFLSLTVFGLAFTVRSTALNPDFISDQLNRLEINSLVKETVQIDPPPEIPNLNLIIYKTVSDIEPRFKEQSGFIIHSVYAYLLGKTQTPDLKSALRQTYLSSDFVTPLINSIDVPSLAGGYITEQISSSIPATIPNLDNYVKEVLTAGEPAIKQEVITVSGPVFDYLLGSSPTLNTSISLAQMENSLKTTLLQVFVDSPPAGLEIGGILVSSIPRDLRGAAFDVYYPTIAGGIPATIPIDQTVFTPQVRADISNGINSAEDGLRQARKYVAMFQQYYTWLLILMLVLALGIVLIVRNVKDVSHRLGIPLLTYGAMEYAGVWVTKYLISSGRMQLPDMSPSLNTWLLQLINDSMKPLEIFSLILLAIGVILTVTSFIYKPKQDLKWS